MKGLIGALLICILIIGVEIPAWGAINSSSFYIQDQWFTIDAQKPYFGLDVRERDGRSVEYLQCYWNEQTFLQLGYNEGNVLLAGSYLWESGWFVGAGYRDNEGPRDYWAFSPGYRVDLENDGYMAVSADYAKYDDGPTMTALEYEGVLRPERARIATGVIYERETYRGESIWVMQAAGSVNYQAAEDWVVGGTIQLAKEQLPDDESYSRANGSIGFTWDNNLAVVNAAVSDSNISPRLIQTGIFFKLGEGFRLGAETDQYEGRNTMIYYSLRYYAGPHRFLLGYDRKSEVWEALYNMDI